LIGLPEELVARRRGRIPAEVFAKELLREEELLVGRYDGTIRGPDPFPERSGYAGGDPSFAFLTTAYAPALVAYLRADLKYRVDAPYELLNREVSRRWDFASVLEADEQGFAGFSAALRFGLVLNPSLRVLIAHGYHDLRRAARAGGAAQLRRRPHVLPARREPRGAARDRGRVLRRAHRSGSRPAAGRRLISRCLGLAFPEDWAQHRTGA
ncbi:MAG: Carboxypeptidase, partial [Geminicoccaceae bacterium]|nr:Carboxypeptidase [Geminicoccaceae bacterium]